MNNKGFSLTEMLIVVSIMGILSAVAIPSYKSYKDHQTVEMINVQLQSVKSGYLTCRLLQDLNNCNDFAKIDAQVQDGFTGNTNTSTNPNQTCFQISKETFKGCYDTSGVISSKADIKNTTKGSCLSGVCKK